MDAIVKHFLTQGPGYVLAAVFLALFLYERNERAKTVKALKDTIDRLTGQLVDVTKGSVQTSVVTTEVLRRVEETLTHIARFALPAKDNCGESNDGS